MSGVTYDTGALIAAERDDRRVWAIHARALHRGDIPVVPAAVLAEAWRGGPAAQLSRFLGGTRIEELQEEPARAAGVLLGRASPGIEVTDATVVESALRRGDAVLTSNRDHLQALATAAGRQLDVVDC